MAKGKGNRPSRVKRSAKRSAKRSNVKRARSSKPPASRSITRSPAPSSNFSQMARLFWQEPIRSAVLQSSPMTEIEEKIGMKKGTVERFADVVERIGGRFGTFFGGLLDRFPKELQAVVMIGAIIGGILLILNDNVRAKAKSAFNSIQNLMKDDATRKKEEEAAEKAAEEAKRAAEEADTERPAGFRIPTPLGGVYVKSPLAFGKQENNDDD